MKIKIIASLLFLLTLQAHAKMPVIYDLTCTCIGNFCDNREPIAITFNTKTLFFNGSGKNWSYSAYAVRQVSKTTGVTYVTLPSSYSLGEMTIAIRNPTDPIELEFSGGKYECKVK